MDSSDLGLADDHRGEFGGDQHRGLAEPLFAFWIFLGDFVI